MVVNDWEIKIWCVRCDNWMVLKGIAMDCPRDGYLYECEICNYRVVVFEVS